MRDGEQWVLNGAKTFITNGIHSDLVIVVARTDPDAGSHGISRLMVERGMPGFTRGRKLDKIGLHAQDTAELFFDDVRVPADHRRGLLLALSARRLRGGVNMGAWSITRAAAARALAARRDAASAPVRAGESPGLPEARAALRMRYANGEISREDYLQGKVELAGRRRLRRARTRVNQQNPTAVPAAGRHPLALELAAAQLRVLSPHAASFTPITSVTR